MEYITFGEALIHLKNGGMVTKKGWHTVDIKYNLAIDRGHIAFIHKTYKNGNLKKLLSDVWRPKTFELLDEDWIKE